MLVRKCIKIYNSLIKAKKPSRLRPLIIVKHWNYVSSEVSIIHYRKNFNFNYYCYFCVLLTYSWISDRTRPELILL